jgi:hypothetical protein
MRKGAARHLPGGSQDWCLCRSERWRWDLNPRRGCPLTHFRVLRTTVHRRPSASGPARTRSGRPPVNGGGRWRMRPRLRPGEVCCSRVGPHRWTGLIAAGAIVTGSGGDSCCMRSRLAPAEFALSGYSAGDRTVCTQSARLCAPGAVQPIRPRHKGCGVVGAGGDFLSPPSDYPCWTEGGLPA